MLNFPAHVDQHVSTQNFNGGNWQEDIAQNVWSLAKHINSLATTQSRLVTMQRRQGDMYQALSMRLDNFENRFIDQTNCQAFRMAVDSRCNEIEKHLPSTVQDREQQDQDVVIDAISTKEVLERLVAHERQLQVAVNDVTSIKSTLADIKANMEEAKSRVPPLTDVLVEAAPGPDSLPPKQPKAMAHMSDQTMPVTFRTLHDCIGQEAARSVEPSTWESLLFVGLPCVGTSSSLMVVLSVFVNILVQGIFVAISRKEFTEEQLDSFAASSARQWRITDAHSFSAMDQSSWVSLASRVCAADSTLITATAQVDLLQSINTYLGRIPLPLFDEDSSLKVGPLLFSVVMIVWILSIAREFGYTFGYMGCIAALPRARTSQISRSPDGQYLFASSTTLRVWACLSLSLLRFVVACLIAYIGGRWLANTSSLTELVLNAAAMAFVLDLDELVFATLTPVTVQHLIEEMRPLDIQWRLNYNGFDAKPLIVLACTAGGLVLFLLNDVQSMTTRMTQMKYEMCERGVLDFVVTMHDSLGIASGAWTNLVKHGVAAEDTLLKKATAKFMEIPTLKEKDTHLQELALGNLASLTFAGDWPGMFLPTQPHLKEFLEGDTSDMMGGSSCVDILFPTEVRSQSENQKMMSDSLKLATQFRTGLNASSCIEFVQAGHCSKSTDTPLRMMCSRSCGCSYPRSNLLRDRMGCLPGCLAERAQNLDWYNCEDIPVELLNADVRLWASLRDLRIYFPDIHLLLNPLSQQGCSLFAQENRAQLYQIYPEAVSNGILDVLCGTGAKMAPLDATQLGSSSLRPWCPVSCSCLDSFTSDCPTACDVGGLCRQQRQRADCSRVDLGDCEWNTDGGLCRGSRVPPEKMYTNTTLRGVSTYCGEADLAMRSGALGKNICLLMRGTDEFLHAKETCCEHKQ